ncbi:hypothetical protein B0H14DRAFT_3143818 [Mycena olivaceomarginata]|nr:hypothetical protein B0H14DRAFT_3143818 [Mycena olivaceomarginata]
MTSSQALIPWEPVSNNGVVATQESLRPEGKWALILTAFLSPSPGRTLDQVYTAAGKVLETHVNRVAFKLGLGPHVIAGKIKLHFGDGEHRMQQLELLQTTVPPKLKKQCLKLMKYSLLTESANTQCQTFKEIVDLVTLLPGLSVLFLQTKVLDNITSLDTISALWDQSTGPPDKEWTFWQTLAATGLADTAILVITEKSLLPDLVACNNEGLSIIEQLLVEQWSVKIYKCTLPAVLGWGSQSTWALAEFGTCTCSSCTQVVLSNGLCAERHWGGYPFPRFD